MYVFNGEDEISKFLLFRLRKRWRGPKSVSIGKSR